MSVGIGDALRDARQAQDRSLQDAAQSLRVRVDYVQALEDEEFSVFGADTYARGHLRNYASLLGLDPQPLVDTYDRYVRTDDQTAHHFADAPVAMRERQPLPRWVTVIGGMTAVLAAIAAIGLLGSRTPAPSEQDDGLAGSPTPTVAPSTPRSSASPTPSASPSPTPSPTPTFEGVEMLLIVEGRSYMEIQVDDQTHPRSGQIIEAGETIELQADDQVQIRYGNAGGVLVEVNGESYGRPGGNGEVIDVTYGPNGPIDGAGETSG